MQMLDCVARIQQTWFFFIIQSGFPFYFFYGFRRESESRGDDEILKEFWLTRDPLRSCTLSSSSSSSDDSPVALGAAGVLM